MIARIDLRNMKVTVVGLGDSGLKSALLLESVSAIVSVTDNTSSETVNKNARLLEEKYIDLEVGKHTESFLAQTELMVVSPGVENSSLPVRYAEKNNIPIISELELGYNFCEGPIVAITGTNGKSTCVSLLGEMFRRAGKDANVCGNIGNSLSGEVKNIKKNTIVVLETSSYQLERIVDFRPRIAVILNVTEDHLDRYANFDEYFQAKKRIFENQKKGDILILNYDDPILRKLSRSGRIASRILYFSKKKKTEGLYFDNGDLKIFLKSKERKLFKLKDTKLQGAHNVENILICALIATLLGVKKKFIEDAVKDFTPLSHRFETVRIIDGIEFIDDSKATNIDAACRALESLKKPAILIAGGKDKNLSYEKVLPAVKKNIKKIILIGETRHKMRRIFEGSVAVEEKDSLEEAVYAAYKSARTGESVLLSPMCSSFDMFRDYKHRGEVFREAVEKL